MATYYWVGGAGTWDATTTTNWSASSGGSGNAGVPTSADDVIFNSSGGTGTVSVGTGAVCNNMTASSYAGALGGTGTLTVSGSFLISSGFTSLTFSGTLIFSSSNIGNTISTSSNPISGISFIGTGSWRLLSNLACGSPLKTLLFTSGTIDLNTFFLGSAGSFTSNNTNTKSLIFGTGGYLYWGTGSSTGSSFTWDGTNLSVTGTPRLRISSSTTSSTVQNITLSNFSESNAFNLDWTGSTTTAGVYRILGTNPAVRDFDLSSYNGPYYGVSSTNISVYGNLILSSASTAGTYFGISPILKSSASDTKVIDLKTKTPVFANGIIILGGGSGSGSYTLANTMNITNISSTANSISIFGGTFNANGYDVIATGNISLSSSNTRQIIMGSGEWKTFSQTTGNTNNVMSWDCTDSTNLTVTTNTATINIASFASSDAYIFNTIFNGGNISWPTLKNGSKRTIIIKGNNSFANIVTPFANTNFQFDAGTTTNVNDIAINGSSGSLSKISSTSAGTRFTLNKIGGGTINTYYLNILDSIATGGTWNSYTTNGNVNLGNNSGWNFSPAVGTFNPGFLAFFQY